MLSTTEASRPIVRPAAPCIDGDVGPEADRVPGGSDVAQLGDAQVGEQRRVLALGLALVLFPRGFSIVAQKRSRSVPAPTRSRSSARPLARDADHLVTGEPDRGRALLRLAFLLARTPRCAGPVAARARGDRDLHLVRARSRRHSPNGEVKPPACPALTTTESPWAVPSIEASPDIVQAKRALDRCSTRGTRRARRARPIGTAIVVVSSATPSAWNTPMRPRSPATKPRRRGSRRRAGPRRRRPESAPRLATIAGPSTTPPRTRPPRPGSRS